MKKNRKETKTMVFSSQEPCGLNITANKIEGEGAESLPSFDMLAYTGDIIAQPFGSVIVDLEGMTFKKNVAILWHHNSERPIGHATELKINDGQLTIEGVMSGDANDPFVKKVVNMGKNGFPWQASIGAEIHATKMLEEGEKTTINGREIEGPVTIATKTVLYESSILPLGADSNTATKVSAEMHGEKFTNILGNKMTKFDKWLDAKNLGLAKDLDEKATISLKAMFEAENKENEKSVDLQAQIDEMKRIDGIKAEGKGYENIIASAIENGGNADSVKATVTALKAEIENKPAPVSNINVSASATTQGAIEASMGKAMGLNSDSIKAGISDEDMDKGSSLKDVGIIKASELLLQANGKYSVGMGIEETLELAFSTTSLPTILNNVANKSLMNEYNSKASNVMSVAERVNAKDFKTITWVNIFKDLVLEKVGQHGEMKHGTTSETSYPMSVDQYARTFSVGRKDLINDDLDALRRVFAGYGRGASIAEQRDFWTTFINDSGSFYSVGNNNLLSGAGSALSIDAVSTALQTLWAQTDENGDPIQVSGIKLVVPPSLSIYANQIAKDSTVNETTAEGVAEPTSNPHSGRFEVITESFLDNSNITGGSSTAWYLLADPKDVTSYASLRLASAQEPSIRQAQIGIGGLGIESDCLFDFGSALVDPKGVVKSAGV